MIACTGIFTADQARGCKAKLTVWSIRESDVYDDDTRLKPINFRNTPAIQSERLTWFKRENPEEIDINPGDNEEVLLFLLRTGLEKPTVEVLPSVNNINVKGEEQLVHIKPGNYTFRVEVTAANAIGGWADIEFRVNIRSTHGDPWMTCCLHRNRLRLFRLRTIPGVFDLRRNRG